jgi:hypothetical protein
MKSNLLLLLLSLTACRYLSSISTTPPGPTNNQLLSNGNPVDGVRNQTPQTNRCGYECPRGFVCNQDTAECEATKTRPTDAGISWLP